MQRASSQNATDSIVATLVGDQCSWCTTGTLSREEYKGDTAAVCEDCGTPAVRVW